MKKLNLLLALASGAALLASCGAPKESLFGQGAVASYNEAPRGAHVQSTIDNVAVVTDLKGKITHLRLDTTQVTVTLTEGAHVTKDLTAEGDVKSKWELLGDYGMGSDTVQEWYVQAEKFENWAVGKTLADIKAGVGQDNYLTDKVNIGVTIHVDGWVKALEVALANQVKVAGKIGGLGVGGKVSLAFQRGTQIVNGHDVYVAGGVFDANKKVLAARIDTFQIRYAIEPAVGEVVAKTIVDKTVKQVVAAENRVKGKQELKDEYAMKSSSDIGKEWWEQAAALVEHLKGKTVAEALGTEAELANGTEVGVTITIDGYRATLLEAEHTAFNKRAA